LLLFVFPLHASYSGNGTKLEAESIVGNWSSWFPGNHGELLEEQAVCADLLTGCLWYRMLSMIHFVDFVGTGGKGLSLTTEIMACGSLTWGIVEQIK